MTGLLVAAGAGLGAVLRYLCAVSLDRRLDGRLDGRLGAQAARGGWPVGTFGVNVAGSTLVGAFAALWSGGQAWALLGVGLCGGLTTYSGFAVQVHDLGWRRGSPYAAATVVTSLAGCAAAYAALACA